MVDNIHRLPCGCREVQEGATVTNWPCHEHARARIAELERQLQEERFDRKDNTGKYDSYTVRKAQLNEARDDLQKARATIKTLTDRWDRAEILICKLIASFGGQSITEEQARLIVTANELVNDKALAVVRWQGGGND